MKMKMSSKSMKMVGPLDQLPKAMKVAAAMKSAMKVKKMKMSLSIHPMADDADDADRHTVHQGSLKLLPVSANADTQLIGCNGLARTKNSITYINVDHVKALSQGGTLAAFLLTSQKDIEERGSNYSQMQLWSNCQEWKHIAQMFGFAVEFRWNISQDQPFGHMILPAKCRGLVIYNADMKTNMTMAHMEDVMNMLYKVLKSRQTTVHDFVIAGPVRAAMQYSRTGRGQQSHITYRNQLVFTLRNSAPSAVSGRISEKSDDSPIYDEDEEEESEEYSEEEEEEEDGSEEEAESEEEEEVVVPKKVKKMSKMGKSSKAKASKKTVMMKSMSKASAMMKSMSKVQKMMSSMKKSSGSSMKMKKKN